MSSSYNEEVLNAAEDSVAAVTNRQLTDRAIVTTVFDTLTRAPWWEEVGPEYRFRIGEPWRREISSPSGTEGIVRRDGQIGNGIARPDATYFRDTRWTPPTPPLTVGDVIETVEDLERLPIEAILIDCDNDAWQKAGLNRFLCVTSEGFYTAEAAHKSGPFTIAHLPND